MFTIGKIVLIGACLFGAAAAGADVHIQNLQSKHMMINDGGIGNCIVAFREEDSEPEKISSDEALEIALNHANLQEVSMERHEIHQTHSIPFDTDVYEIEIWTMEKDYTFTIEAVDGRVLDYEVKDIYYQDTQN